MSKAVPRFMLISHTLPPAPSGQSVVLYNLLVDHNDINYCLVSNQNYAREMLPTDATHKLPVSYYKLRTLQRQFFPITNPRWGGLGRRLLPYYNQWVVQLKYPTVSLGAPLEILYRAFQIYRLLRKEKSRVLIGCTADLYNLPATLLAARVTGIPYIAYIFDDYLNQWTGFRKFIAHYLEPLIIKNAAEVIVPNEYMAQAYQQRYHKDTVIIRNLTVIPDLELLDNTSSPFSEDTVNILYTGSVYSAHYQAFFNLVTAIDKLKRDDIKIHIFTSHWHGGLIADGLDSPHIVFHNHQPYEEILAVTRHADILFLPLAFVSNLDEVIKTSLPGKTGAYLAVGKPILVHAPSSSFISWYFRKHECGVVVDSDDVEALAEELQKLVSDKRYQQQLGQKARQQAIEDFDYDVVRGRFLELIQRSCKAQDQ